VAFFAQQDASLKGVAMAFQPLFASLMSCRMVLSLRDTEMLAVQSAAASLATKSFWKTGYTGGEDEHSRQTANRDYDFETARQNDSYQMNGSTGAGILRTGPALPGYPEPVAVQ
jgi:hypothetical protein